MYEADKPMFSHLAMYHYAVQQKVSSWEEIVPISGQKTET
jgi:hypothetical protein